ncbi:hypothetical protein FA95DRAFT_1611246 [Auriscalpium vulgare]|uniref:Uncharacterized protein n=1 Tax=Auriscalpium vulgare TaxID=40419 RepID=A0ACB8RBS6_9AGAM|nr:hypothetical protein FA95DRAFT_1611246 [Auriscalpium vulgare]
MATVPLDVQILIIEWLYRSSQAQTIDYSSLCACALVCRSWTPTAQRLLLRRAPCPLSWCDHSWHFTIPLLLRTLRANSYLATLVHSVHLTLFARTASDSDGPEIELLQLCPNIAGISNSIILTECDDRLTSLEPRLRAIPLRPVFLQVGDSERTICNRIVQMWPSLVSLDIKTWCYENEALLPIHLSSAVQSFTLSYALDPDIAILAPENGLPALRTLELVYPTWSDVQWSDVQCRTIHELQVLPQLHTLILGRIPPPKILTQLSRLKTLVFNCLPAEPVSLPQTLQHVGYHADSYAWEKAKDVMLFAPALWALTHLQLVTVMRCSRQTLLKKACRERGVEFRVYKTTEHHPRVPNVDWI